MNVRGVLRSGPGFLNGRIVVEVRDGQETPLHRHGAVTRFRGGTAFNLYVSPALDFDKTVEKVKMI